MNDEVPAKPKSTRPKRTAKEKAISQAKRAGAAVALGAGMAATSTVSDVFLDMAKDLAEDDTMILAVLESPTGREFIKGIMAFGMQTAAIQGEDIMPGAEYVARAAELQLAESTRAVVAPRLTKYKDKFATYFERLATVGKMLPANTSAEVLEEEAVRTNGHSHARARA